MVTDSSNQPGWGASAGGSGGSSTPPPSTPSEGGKYTDASGKPISKQKAIELGIISGSDVKTAPSGWGGGSAPAKGAPVGVEALKQAELKAATNRTFFLGTAIGDYRETPRELTPESGKAIVASFYPAPQQPEQTQQPPSLSRFIPPPPSLIGDMRTPTELRYYPSQPGSIAEQNAPIRWYNRLHPVVKGAAIVASLDFSIYHSYLSSKLGSGFDPSEGLQLESATMGNETITFKTTKPKVDEIYKKQLYEHYEMGDRPKGLLKQAETGLYKSITSDVTLTGVSAFAFGGAVGAVGRIKGLGFIPGVAGKVAVGVTAADVGLKVATKDYPSAIMTGGVFVAAAPLAMAGYGAGSRLNIGRVGLLEKAQTIKAVRSYNEYVAEAGTPKKFGTFQPGDIQAHNLMAAETAFKTMGLKETIQLPKFFKSGGEYSKVGIDKGWIVKQGTVESHNILTAETPTAIRKMGVYESLITGIRLSKPFTQSELLYSRETKPIQEYNLMVKETQFSKLSLAESYKYGKHMLIEQHNKLVSESTLPKQIKVPVSVMDILMVGGQRFAPAPRLRPTTQIKPSKSGLRITSRSIKDRGTSFISIPVASDLFQNKTIDSNIAAKAHKDLLKQNKAVKQSQRVYIGDMSKQFILDIQGVGQVQGQFQEQGQSQAQQQKQLQEQTQRGFQTVRPRFDTLTKIKPEIIKKPKTFKFPSATPLLSKKKRKSKRMGRFFIEISPVKSVGTNIFKGMSAYKPIKIKGMKL